MSIPEFLKYFIIRNEVILQFKKKNEERNEVFGSSINQTDKLVPIGEVVPSDLDHPPVLPGPH